MDCEICLEKTPNGEIPCCKHILCQNCLTKITDCPWCRKLLVIIPEFKFQEYKSIYEEK